MYQRIEQERGRGGGEQGEEDEMRREDLVLMAPSNAIRNTERLPSSTSLVMLLPGLLL